MFEPKELMDAVIRGDFSGVVDKVKAALGNQVPAGEIKRDGPRQPDQEAPAGRPSKGEVLEVGCTREVRHFIGTAH